MVISYAFRGSHPISSLSCGFRKNYSRSAARHGSFKPSTALVEWRRKVAPVLRAPMLLSPRCRCQCPRAWTITTQLISTRSLMNTTNNSRRMSSLGRSISLLSLRLRTPSTMFR
eukprot:s4156_g7.t1